jgi:hypothetical protein
MSKESISWGTKELLSYGVKCPNGGAYRVAVAALLKKASFVLCRTER